MSNIDDNPTGMYELFDAIEAVIRSSDPAKRAALAETIDAFAEDFPDEFFWATGAQSPVFLHHMMSAIDIACREKGEKPRAVLRLVDRKPEGNA
jgi:hypothetical protein